MVDAVVRLNLTLTTMFAWQFGWTASSELQHERGDVPVVVMSRSVLELLGE